MPACTQPDFSQCCGGNHPAIISPDETERVAVRVARSRAVKSHDRISASGRNHRWQWGRDCSWQGIGDGILVEFAHPAIAAVSQQQRTPRCGVEANISRLR